MRNFILLSTTTITLAVLAACTDPDQQACTAELVPSVRITILEGGQPATGETVQFSVDEGAFEDCEDWGDAWACGLETPGEIVVRVTSAGGTVTERSYSIAQDVCHVVGLSDTLDLVEELNCTEEARPSVELTVTDGVDVIADATARWRPVASDGAAWEDCFGVESKLFCGTEWSGEMEIEASAPGFEPATTTVAISADECHVLTEITEIALPVQ